MSHEVIKVSSYGCPEQDKVKIKGSLQVKKNLKVDGCTEFCTLYEKDVFPCNGDTIFNHAQVASGIKLNNEAVGIFKSDGLLNRNRMDLLVLPTGSGALRDSSGGNPRGFNAVDLQMIRSENDQVASGRFSVITGGGSNRASGIGSFIGGGFGNVASRDTAVVVGGRENTSNGGSSFIGGGQLNNASGSFSSITGGLQNIVMGDGASVIGGLDNVISGGFTTIGNGFLNSASGNFSSLGSGILNNVSAGFAFLGSGFANNASGDFSFIGGGLVNTIGTAGIMSVVPGGGGANIQHPGCFVFGSTDAGPTTTQAPNQAIFNLEGTPFSPAGANTFWINGDFSVTGVKAFTIPHPLDPTQTLRHYCTEGPDADLIYRGKAELKDGSADVDIDVAAKMLTGTFEKLTSNPQVYLTNNKNFDLVRVEDELTVPTGKFRIISNNLQSTVIVNWLVIAKRNLPPSKNIIVPSRARNLSKHQDFIAQAKKKLQK